MRAKERIKSQYHAALAMLRQAIDGCPDSLWESPDDKNQFWHIAYHTLFYTHLYLQPTESDSSPWEKHQEAYTSLSIAPDIPEGERVYPKEELLEYLEFCLVEVDAQIEALDLAAESGFYWLPFDKLELQFYNIRHNQHHTGELSERLGARGEIEVDWVGMKPNQDIQT